MSTNLDHLTKEHSVVGASSGGGGGGGGGAATWSSAVATAPPHLLSQDESVESVDGDAHCCEASFSDSLDSSQSFSDSLKCHRHSVAGTLDSAESLTSFSDSLEHSGEESDVTTTTLDSDSGSFYSVNSYRTVSGRESVSSLINADYCSESTLYDSAQSLHTARASSPSSCLSLESPSIENDVAVTWKHRNSLSVQPHLPQCSTEPRESDSYWEYTSCPDLSTAGYRKKKSLLPSPTRLSPLFNKSLFGSNSSSSNSPRLSSLKRQAVTSASMDTVDGGPSSPRQGEEGDSKKKKGLMPSFRKSRKTGRKLRQQKKAAAENDVLATGKTKGASDEEQELLFDWETSAPNSPAVPVKGEAVSQDAKMSQESLSTMDSHQATHERLNGTASPKGSSSRSKTPSPVVPKNANMAPEVKKTEEKEDKKKEKSKFSSLLSRKDKKPKTDSASKTSLISNTSASSSVTSDASFVSAADTDAASVSSEVKAGGKMNVKDETKSVTTAPHSNLATRGASQEPADPQDPSFRSYISTVQFVKNYTVNTQVPQDNLQNEPRSKISVQVPKKKVTIDDKKMVDDSSPPDEAKKKISASASGKPSSAEVTSTRKTTVTIVSKQVEHPKVIKIPSPSTPDKPTIGPVASPSSPQGAVPPSSPQGAAPPSSRLTVRPTTIKPTSNITTKSRSPTPPTPRRVSLENITVPIPKNPAGGQASTGTDGTVSATRYKPLPLSVTPPERDDPGKQGGRVEAASATGPTPAPAPAPATPPSSPEGHGRQARETPEGDRSEGEKNQLMESSGLTSGSWAGSSTDKREHLYKILVIGELGTGKTSIIKRYVHQFFSQHYRATIGVDFALKVLNWDSNTVIRLQLWDIAGQERFGNMTRVYYKEAVGAFVVFDVTRAQTFDAVTKWKTDLDTKVTLADGSPIPTVLLANKCDQPKEGVVNNPARMDDYCRERGFCGWFETSAKENINIDEASRYLVNKILSNEKQGMMLTESMDTDKFSVDGRTNPVDKTGCRC